MARSFNLTAELNLRGPSNVRLVVADIRRQLQGVNVDVGVRIDPAAARNIANIQNNLTRFNTTLGQTQTNANSAAAAVQNLSRAVASLSTNLNAVPRNVQNLAGNVNNLTRNLGQANTAVQQTTSQFEEFGRQSALAVRRFAAFATVTGLIYKVSNAIGSATKEFVDFNKELIRVAQVTDEPVQNLGGLVDRITRLSTGLGVTSKELIQVSSTLAQAGLSAQDTAKALEALALSALAPSFDSLNDTVEGSIALMRQFGIGAGDLKDALGSVNAVAAKFAVEAGDLITAIQRTGGVFATASKGVSEGKDALNEFLAVFTSVRATTRESAETIATGLRTIFTRIQRTETIDALTRFGVVLTDLEGKFVGPYEAVRRLSEGLSKLDPRDLRFSDIVEELGGFRQIGKVIPLIQQFATAQAALKVAQEGQGSLAKDAATAQQSVANQLVKVREEFNALVRSIGQSESFQTFIKLSLDLASGLIKLADSAKTVLPALTAIAAIRGVSALAQFGVGFTRGLRRQNAGGPVRGFASGGYVPGVGNSDTVPAMLTPGEFVIRKKAVESIGLSSLQNMNKYAFGGKVQKFASGGLAKHLTTDKRVGAAVLESGDMGTQKISIRKADLESSAGFPIDSAKLPSLRGITGIVEGLSTKSSQIFNEALDQGIIRGVNLAAIKVSKNLGIPFQKIDQSSTTSFLSGINSGTRGNMFEDILFALKESPGPFSTREKGQSFDFPAGLPALTADDFPNLPTSWVDAKASFGAASASRPGSLQNKTFRQLVNEIIADRPYYEGKGKEEKKPVKAGVKALAASYVGKDFNSREVQDRLNQLGYAGANRADTEDIRKFLSTGTVPTRGVARNKVLQFIGQRKGLASGGSISGEDTVPALLTPGEFVINKRAASRIGMARLNKLNNADKITGFNSGGPVGGVYKFAKGGVAPGDVEARIQRAMQTFEALINNVQSQSYAANRRSGMNATDALQSARSTAMNTFTQTATAAVGGASGNRRQEMAEASARVIAQYMERAATSAKQSSGFFDSMKATANSVSTSVTGFTKGIGNKISGSSITKGLTSVGTRMQAGGGIAGLALTMGGGLAVESLSKAAGGEKTVAGNRIANMGGDALNYGATGAMLGSMFGPLGTVLGGLTGAVVGLTTGFFKAKEATEAYAQSQRVDTATKAGETSSKVLQSYLSGPPTASGRAAAMSALRTTSQAEDVALYGAKRQKGQTLQDFAAEQVKTQQAGAEQTKSFIAAEMMRTGKTFAELRGSMDPAAFADFAKNIAQSDANFLAFQISAKEQIDKMKASGADPAAIAMAEKELADRQKAMAENLAARQMAEQDAAVQAANAAKASAKLAVQLEKSVLSLEKTFGAMDQVLNKVGFDIGQAAKQREEIVSGRASLTGGGRARDINILQNPNAYSAAEAQAARRRSASVIGGRSGDLAMRVSTFTDTARNAATRTVAAGARQDQTKTAQDVQNALLAQIEGTFGADTSIGRDLSASVRSMIQEKIREVGEKGGDINFDELINSALGPIQKASEQANNLLISATERLSQAFDELGNVAQATADIQKRQKDRSIAFAEMRSGSLISQREAMGEKIKPEERIRARLENINRRAGIGGAGAPLRIPGTSQAMGDRIQSLQAEQKALAKRRDDLEKAGASAAPELLKLQTKLANVNNELEDTKKSFESLPQDLEGMIGDLTSSISERVAELESRKEAGANFAERLVGSTPQELAEINRSYQLLNNTLNGNIVTINRSQGAQQAYYEALKNGKTQQEAYADAQQQFATETKNAMSLFNDIMQMSGVKGAEFDKMRADLLVNFARAQGMGLENNPMFQKIIQELRKPPEQRAAQDPLVQELTKRAEVIRAEQDKAIKDIQAMDQAQIALLQATGAKIVQDINAAKLQVEVAVQNVAAQAGQQAGYANGGIVYASTGKLINFQPKGTDTVPAMLTPGEFVVNAKATKKNLPLLRSINKSKGGPVYLANGGTTDGKDVVAGNLIANGILSGLRNLQNQSNSIQTDTSETRTKQLPGLRSRTDSGFSSNNKSLTGIQKNTEETNNTLKKITDATGLSGGGVVYASSGKLIGAKSRGSDTVPAMLTPGEFVVNREATKNNLGLLQNINSGYFADGGRIPRLNRSGLLGMSVRAQQARRPNQVANYTSDPAGYSREAKIIMQEIADQISSNPEILKFRMANAIQLNPNQIGNNIPLQVIAEENPNDKATALIGKIIQDPNPQDAAQNINNLITKRKYALEEGEYNSNTAEKIMLREKAKFDQRAGIRENTLGPQWRNRQRNPRIPQPDRFDFGDPINWTTWLDNQKRASQEEIKWIAQVENNLNNIPIPGVDKSLLRPYAQRSGFSLADWPKADSFSSGGIVYAQDGMRIPNGMGVYKAGRGPYSTNTPSRITDFDNELVLEQVDHISTILSSIGLIPGIGEPFDLASAAIDASRGNYTSAGLSLASAVPIAGIGAGLSKITARVQEIKNTIPASAGGNLTEIIKIRLSMFQSLKDDIAKQIDDITLQNKTIAQNKLLKTKELAEIQNKLGYGGQLLPISRGDKISLSTESFRNLPQEGRDRVSALLRAKTGLGATSWRQTGSMMGENMKILGMESFKDPLAKTPEQLLERFKKGYASLWPRKGMEAHKGGTDLPTVEDIIDRVGDNPGAIAEFDAALRVHHGHANIVLDAYRSGRNTDLMSEAYKIFSSIDASDISQLSGKSAESAQKILDIRRLDSEISALDEQLKTLSNVKSQYQESSKPIDEAITTAQRLLSPKAIESITPKGPPPLPKGPPPLPKGPPPLPKGPPPLREEIITDVWGVPQIDVGKEIRERRRREGREGLYYNRGGVVYAASGQLISYEPKGTDTVPAMLTPGEFVVNRQATQNNLPLLQSINSGQYSRGGKVAYLAEGTPGTDAIQQNLKYLSDILMKGAENLNIALTEAVNKINGVQNPQNTTKTNGVSNSSFNIDALGNRLDQFIQQLQNALPPVIKVEGRHDVNVIINGGAALQNALQGPIGQLVQTEIQKAFDLQNRKNELA